MFEQAVNFGEEVFTALVLLLSAAVASHIMYGYGTKHARECFVGIVLLMMFGYQLYYLILSSQFVPAGPEYTYDKDLLRSDCKLSSKGGKRPLWRQEYMDMNPCFCHAGANCFKRDDDDTPISSDGTCPTDGDHYCVNPVNNKKIDLWVSAHRNCNGGQGPACTKDQPCNPCDVDELIAWGHVGGSGRCVTCSADFRGDCGFTDEEGPYCRVEKDSKSVVPCPKCCSGAPKYRYVDGDDANYFTSAPVGDSSTLQVVCY